MARTRMAGALLVMAGVCGMMVGCKSSSSSSNQPVNNGVARSTYGNIEHSDPWGVRERPAAPKPVAAAPAPRAAPAQTGNCMYLPTGDRASSSLSVCCAMPGEVIAGQSFTYSIEVCNLTNATLDNVNVAYNLDDARIVSSEPSMGSGGFAIGDLPPKGCRSIRITATPIAVGTVHGCASATWANTLCCATNVVQPALKLVKDVHPTDITPCDVVTYTITVSNTGTGAASNVKIMDDLPSGVMSDNRSSMSWDIGTLGGGQSRTTTFTAKAAHNGTYTNRARAAADGGLTATSGDATFSVHNPTLAITTVCPAKVYIGRPSQFKVTVSNKGDAPAVNTMVEDTFPAGLTFASASDNGSFSGGHVTWNLGTLAPGASKELTVNCNGGALGSVQNTCTARCACGEAVSTNCSTTFEGVPDIGTSIIDDNGVVPLGAEHVFHYRVRNQGQIDLTNVKMVATLDSGLDFKRSTSVNGAAAGNEVTFSIGTVHAGAEVVIDIICTGSKTGELVIRTRTSCDQTKEVRNDEQVNYVER